MELLKKILHNTVFSINIVAILFLILSSFSDRVSPHFFILFPFLGLIFPFIVIVNLFFFIWWLIVWQWKKILVCLAAFVICSGAMFTYYPLHFKTKKTPDDCIKVLTYNTMLFDHQAPHTKKRINRTVRYLQESNADIICIQEYCTTENKNYLTTTKLRSALKKYPYFHVFDLIKKSKSEIYGLAIFSKFPILSTEEIPFESLYNGAFQAVLDIRGKRTTLINLHLESNKLSAEDRTTYYKITKHFNSDQIDTLTSIIAKRLFPAYKIRAKQAEIVAKKIKQNKNPYLIVCGDFNDTPISYARKTIKGDLKDAFVESGSGMGISYNQSRFLFRIDNIFHSKNIKAYNCTVDKVRYSDHYPVWTLLHLD